MAQTSREIVRSCLTFDNPERIPRDLWLLPWMELHHPGQVAAINARFPSDFGCPDYWYDSSDSLVRGDPYRVGTSTDEWGCQFRNLQEGIIGEVEHPLIEQLDDWHQVRPPYNLLPENLRVARDRINRSCAEQDLFIKANCCPRPWERYQFLRGSQNALLDMLMPDDRVIQLLHRIHDFYLREMELWVQTDVDGIMFMDDWGAQNQLLINPDLWRELFKPLYREYCELAHSHDKFVFTHSDGHITAIYSDLIEIGVDALNSQLFCMDLAELAEIARGKITFWGEIDRQHILPAADPEVGREAVREVARHLYDPAGGIIAQFELGIGANPETGMAVFEEWDEVSRGAV